MSRYRKCVWESSFLSFVLSVGFGMGCGLCCCAVLSAVTFFVFRAMMFEKLFALMTLFAGGYSAGWICGKFRRRRGMTEGALCGCLIYLVLLAISFYMGGSGDIKKLLLLMASGAFGGISGVNSPRPKDLFSR